MEGVAEGDVGISTAPFSPRQAKRSRSFRNWALGELTDLFYFLAYRAVLVASLRKMRRMHQALIRRVRRSNTIFLSREEIDQLIDAVQAVRKLDGDLAEVGVFEGATARLMAEASPGKPLHLFDTFEGLPYVDSFEGKVLFRKGQFKARISAEDLRVALSCYPNVHVYKGIFPDDSGQLVESRRFSFVHLDVDVYRRTKDCLEFFYPRMNKGGILLSHDYILSIGVKKAFDEFFGDKAEPVIRCAGSQCMIVKV